MVREIPLRNRRGETLVTALVDDEDYEQLSRFTWHAIGRGRPGKQYVYAARTEHIGVRKWPVLMHRQILGLEKGDLRTGDHINHNTLDNRRGNLRIATKAENLQNREGAKVNSSSGIRGVYWHKQRGKWGARAMLRRRPYSLGLYASKEDAVRAVQEWRAKNMPYSSEATSRAA